MRFLKWSKQLNQAVRMAPTKPNSLDLLLVRGSRLFPQFLAFWGVVLLAIFPLERIAQWNQPWQGAFSWRIPVLLLGSGFAIAKAEPNRVTRAFARAWPVAAMLGFGAFSILWTVDVAVTLRAVIEPFVGFTTCLALVVSIPQRKLLDVLACCGVFLTIGHFIASSKYPALAVEGGTWMGLTVNRNILGMNTAVFFPFMFFAMGGKFSVARIWRYVIFGFGLGLGCYVLYRSGSKTSMAALLATSWFFSVYAIFRVTHRMASGARGAVRSIGLLIASVATASVVKWLFDTNYLRWDTTFSLRTPIWKASIRLAKLHWQNGLGYGGWSSTKGYFKQATWDFGTTGLTHIHNSFIQHFLDMGVIGVALMVIAFAVLGVRWAKVLSPTQPFEAGFGIVLWGTLVLLNCLESRMLFPSLDLMWPMMCFLALMPPPQKRGGGEPRLILPTRIKRAVIGIGVATSIILPLSASRPIVAPSALGNLMTAEAKAGGVVLRSEERDVLFWIGWYVTTRPDLQESFVNDGVPNTKALLEWAASRGDSQAQSLKADVVAELGAKWVSTPPPIELQPADLGVVDDTAVSNVTEPIAGLTPEIDSEPVPVSTETIPGTPEQTPGLPG
jgi:exopolysaccharide production protein ExoQ